MALGLATSALGACARTPDPPAQCNLVQVSVDWEQFHPLSQQTDLDSLRSLIGRTGDDDSRAHLVQEYVFVANRLGPTARREALGSVAKVLGRSVGQ